VELGWRIWEWAGLILAVAIVYVLVRPGSRAGELIEGFTGALVAMVRAATDTA